MNKFLNRFVFFAIILLFACSWIEALDNPAATSHSEIVSVQPNYSEPQEQDRFLQEFLSMITTLGIIVAVILFISWFLKRLVNSRIQQVNTVSLIKIIDHRSLSPKSTIYLIEIYGKQLLVGETTHGIATLKEFSKETMSSNSVGNP